MAAYLDTLAEALLQNGESDEALATETQAVGLDPQNAELQSRLVRFHGAAQPKAAPK
jgi:cytochrome c-type biogenesis protein CcmH/NrfG